MKNENINATRFMYLNRIMGAVVFFWTFIVICSASWNVYCERLQILALAKNEAVANFNKDLSFRLWGTSHGGVYVPPTEQTPPNPYLSHIPDRDITLPSGKRLTLMNPAYMVRQMMANYSELYGIKGRITSLKPLNPDNAPDAWEREALTAFEKGAKEFFVITEQDGQQSLRLMRSMEAKAGCLKCHGQQGYKEGDIRGGVGVMVPMAPYRIFEKKMTERMVLSHLVIWLLGLTALGFIYYWGKTFILEQGKIEEALWQSERRFRRFFEQAPLPFAHVNKEGGLVDLNDRFVQVFGYTLDDVSTLKEWWQLAYPDEEYRRLALETWEAAVAKAAKEKTEIEPVEYKVTCKNGAKRNVLIGGITINDSLLVTFVDITERKRGEEALRSERDFSNGLIETAPAIVLVLDTEGCIVRFNPYMEEISGYTLAEVQGKDWFGTFLPERDRGQARDLYQKALDEIRTIGNVNSIITKDGREVEIEWFDKSIKNAQGKILGLIAIGQDITERKRGEEALNRLNEELEQRVRERTKELERRNYELEQMNKAFVGRELKMVELKERVKELEGGR